MLSLSVNAVLTGSWGLKDKFEVSSLRHEIRSKEKKKSKIIFAFNKRCYRQQMKPEANFLERLQCRGRVQLLLFLV